MLPEWNVPFRALLDAAPDGIVACDARGLLVLVNSAAERMFGYAHDELLGVPIWPETRATPVIGLSAAALTRDTTPQGTRDFIATSPSR